MKVLHMISGGDTGGAKTHVLSLLHGLNKQIQADLVCYMEAGFAKDARRIGINTHVYDGSFVSAAEQTKKLIKSEGYDIVHCHGSRANFIGSILKKHFDIPFISTVHSDYRLDYLGRPLAAATYGQLNKMALRQMDLCVCVSDSMRDTLISRGYDPNVLLTIYNGIDMSKPLPTIDRDEWFRRQGCNFGGDDIVLGIAARLDPVKDVGTTVRAFAKASESNEKLRLFVAGDGLEAEALHALADELGVNDKVFFAGWIDDMNGYYSAIDINAISSLSETFPYAVTEAARAKKPTVASRVGGLPALIISGETGMLFKPKDADDMSRCIISLAESEQLRKALGEAVYDKARREFSLESTCRRQIDIYKTVLYRKNHPRNGIVICGAYGHGNSGDEALLTAITNEFKSLNRDIRITVVSKRARSTKAVHGMNAVYRWQFLKLRRILRKTELFVSGGGSLIQDVTSRRSLWFYLRTIKWAKECGCKVQIYGCGMGPLRYEKDRQNAAQVINECVDAITLRDPMSLDYSREIGINVQDIFVTGDPVVNLKGRSDQDAEDFLSKSGIDPDANYVCLGLRRWRGIEEHLDDVRAAVKLCHERYGLVPLFMPMNYKKDVLLSDMIMTGLDIPYEVMPETDDPELEIAVMRRMKLCIAMRLHSLLYAACGDVPAVGISYDPKVAGCAMYMGITSIDISGVTADDIEKAIVSALEGEGSAELKRRLAYIKRAEKMNLETAKELLGQGEK